MVASWRSYVLQSGGGGGTSLRLRLRSVTPDSHIHERGALEGLSSVLQRRRSNFQQQMTQVRLLPVTAVSPKIVRIDGELKVM